MVRSRISYDESCWKRHLRSSDCLNDTRYKTRASGHEFSTACDGMWSGLVINGFWLLFFMARKSDNCNSKAQRGTNRIVS